MTETETPRSTPLRDLHEELGARMVPFAGYSMPVQYRDGILAEHIHTRTRAGLFDVSHMGQVRLRGGNAAERLETLVPGDIRGLAVGRMRYTFFTNAEAGILDDLMVTGMDDGLSLVVNAACKEADIAHLRGVFGPDLEVLEDRALLALQGPDAEAVLAGDAPEIAAMKFMSAGPATIGGIPCFVSRSGYTGEDGFEISVPATQAEALARHLLAAAPVSPIGLGARDSLRLEAGLCLYGHDIDTATTPVEAGLTWAIGKRRREEGGYPGDAIVSRQIRDGAPRRRVGLRPAGRAPAREGTEITAPDGRPIGRVTSGGYGPTVEAPVAMGYVETGFAEPGTEVLLVVRGKPLAASVVRLPFVTPNYKRG